MKSFIVLVVVTLAILVGIELNSFNIQNKETARAGQIDLRMSLLSSKSIIPLTGQWTYYPSQLLAPSDIPDHSRSGKTFIRVPHVWGQGYGTYQLEIQLNPQERQFFNAIYIPSISSAYRIWINEQEVRTSGLVGTTRSTMRAQDNPGIVAIPNNRSTKLDIVIDVSNFVQHKGGIGEKLLLGNLQSLIRFYDINLFTELFIVGSLFITGLYFVVFYFGRPREKFSLYYALLCGDVAMQSFFLNSSNMTTLIPWFGWITDTRLQYLSGSIGLILIILVTNALYPHDSRHVPNLIFVVLGSLFSGIFLITPPWMFTNTLDALSLLITLAVFYMLFVFIRAIKMRRDNAIANFIALLFFAASVVNDILYYSNVIQSGNLIPDGLFVFVIIQTITFSRKYAQTIFDLEQTTKELSFINDELELRIQERTRKLEDTMKELQQSNVRLEQLSMIDGLTTIPNRRYFEITVKKKWLELSNVGSALTILLIDIDFFKQYNDNYGHVQGDICLRKVATTLESQMIPYIGSFVSRIGGEEFAVVIPHAETKTVLKLVETLRQLIMNLKIPHAGSEIHPFVTISIGWVREVASSSDGVLNLIRKADDALYHSKREGRNQATMFNLGTTACVESAGRLENKYIFGK